VRHLVATALLVAAVGCAATPPGEGDATVDARVTVIPEISGMVVEAESLRIPRDGNGSLAALQPGDILVSAAGEGFLRKVTSVTTTADEIVLATTDAELTDALIDAELATSVGGDGKADTYQLPGINFSLKDYTLLGNAAITAKLVNGSLSFAPELDLDLSIADRAVQNFEMVLRGRVSGRLDLEIVAASAEVGPEVVLWQSPPAVFYQQVGILPVVETVTTSVVLKVQATTRGHGRLSINADALATLEAGVRYTAAAGWDGVGDASLTAHGSIPEASVTLDQVGVKAWLAARADVRLYGLAGPFVAAGPQVHITKDLQDGHFGGEVGFRAGAGGGFKFLRFNVPAVPTFDIFDKIIPIL
jgi:hypothetical protein